MFGAWAFGAGYFAEGPLSGAAPIFRLFRRTLQWRIGTRTKPDQLG